MEVSAFIRHGRSDLSQPLSLPALGRRVPLAGREACLAAGHRSPRGPLVPHPLIERWARTAIGRAWRSIVEPTKALAAPLLLAQARIDGALWNRF